ncbi:MAG: GNAT family N-acetyltransferase [Candidatus Limnocylindria bacterium]
MIRTDRLLLRRWREADREPFAALNADPAVREHYQGLASREISDAYVDSVMAHWDGHDWGPWAVEIPDTAPFIGSVGLWPAEFLPTGPAIEIGWRLAREHWGHGYATEAAREALGVGFTELGLSEIVSFTVPQNGRSIAVMERIGLDRDPARDFDHPRVDGVAYPQLVRHVLYRLSREAWQAAIR